jgi:hypothetical protein
MLAVHVGRSGKMLVVGNVAMLNIGESWVRTPGPVPVPEDGARAAAAHSQLEGGATRNLYVDRVAPVFIPCSFCVGFNQRVHNAYFFFDLGMSLIASRVTAAYRHCGLRVMAMRSFPHFVRLVWERYWRGLV